MTGSIAVTVVGPDYWANNAEQLAQLLAHSKATAFRAPGGTDTVVTVTSPREWATLPHELRDALVLASSGTATVAARTPPSRLSPGVGTPVEQRLVYTVEEAATLLGISRSFAYEAVQRGDVPSMRIGRRILVPKAALERFLESAGG